MKRVVGVVLCALPFVVVGWSAIEGPRSATTLSMVLLALAALTAVLNFYLSFVRPLVHRIRLGPGGDVKHISGLPAVGTISVMASLLSAWGSASVATIAFVVLLIDTGGLPWFVVATWKDQSLWGGAA